MIFDLDHWKEISTTLRANGLRTLLTAFGVFWGIIIFMAMLAFSSALEDGAARQLKGRWDYLGAWGGRTTEAFDGMRPGRGIRLTVDDLAAVRRLPAVMFATSRIAGGGTEQYFQVVYKSKSEYLEVKGDHPEFPLIYFFEFHAGRFINEQDIAERRKVAVIGKITRDRLFGNEDPIGKTIEITGVPFQVIGVANSTRDMNDMMRISVPFSTYHTMYPDGFIFLGTVPKPGVTIDDLETQVVSELARRHRVAPSDKLAFNTKRHTDIAALRQKLGVVSWLIGGLTLLASVIGISNIMMITVRERTLEIGVRKALGARRSSILWMVMKETLVLTTVASLLGVAAGTGLLILAKEALAQMPGLPLGTPSIEFGTVLRAIAILACAGAVAGIIPAFHAASVRPIEALRSK